jgi:cellulose synthase/poly-beta-1,6-N-acetylglucosamine synthase-like glycosyltransferase
MDEPENKTYRGMRETTSAAGFNTAFTEARGERSRAITPPDAGSSLMALSIVPIVVLLLFGFATAPALTLMMLAAAIGLSWLPIFIGFAKSVCTGRPVDANRTMRADELPSVTILLPLKDEANMVQQLADMLRRIEYPAELIDCLVLLEADDRATALAAIDTQWPDFVRIVSVPDGQPRTKGRACNYGLYHSAGELVVIFDAEDKPHPKQIAEAAAQFAQADAQLACLQAPLHIVPQKNKWLQWQFAFEYRVLFHFKLPHLDAALACLPLGGSSNYFRRAALLKVGAWDAHNLTEDADLALRFAGYGYRIGTLRRPTLENAPHDMKTWFPQRTRWHSGHIQIMHAYAAWSLRHGRGDPNGFKWRFAMLACMAVLAARLLSGVFFLASLIMTIGAFEIGLPPIFIDSCLFIGAIYALVLIRHAPADNWLDNAMLIITHPIYWILTIMALGNAAKRMALGQLGWLKSTHQPYARITKRDDDEPYRGSIG